MLYSSFPKLIEAVYLEFQTRATLIKPPRWQGIDVSKSMYMETYELLNHSSTVELNGTDLSIYQKEIQPDLPWADNHFEERVCGYPLNPGFQWHEWRHGKGADSFREADGRFNHNYMERFWPKYARKVPPSEFPQPEKLVGLEPHRGIYYVYGDLNDLVGLLNREPLTRQAFLPMFFPEDTGSVHQGRAPCSLGWHFICRDKRLHCVYYLRSCDLINHWRNDLYMTVRLMIWVLTQLRLSPTGGEYWVDVDLGLLTTHITSFHCFRGEFSQIRLFGI